MGCCCVIWSYCRIKWSHHLSYCPLLWSQNALVCGPGHSCLWAATAILEFNGNDNKGDSTGDAFSIHHDNLIIRGLQIDCTSPSGNNAWDCYNHNGVRAGSMVSNVLTEDVYVHDSGHLLLGCFSAENIEVRYSTFDFSGIDHHQGEAIYASSSSKDHPCHNVRIHHNFFSRYRANQVDMKSQTRNVVVENNIWMNKKQHITANTSADGDVRTGRKDPQPPGTTAAGNYYRNNITLRARDNYFYTSDDGHRMDLIGNVISIWANVTGNTMKLNGTDTISQAVSQNNIVCGAETPVIEGVNRTHGGLANKLNRPTSECNTRIDQLIGKPTVSSCEIGNINNTTVVVNIQTDVHPPVSSVGKVGGMQVTYDGVAQTESAIVLSSGQQARITMASPPANSSVAVRLTAPAGVIKNSAFIGGRTCGTTSFNGTTKLASLTLGQGICGGNNTQTNFVCQNNITGGENPPPLAAPTELKVRSIQN